MRVKKFFRCVRAPAASQAVFTFSLKMMARAIGNPRRMVTRPLQCVIMRPADANPITHMDDPSYPFWG